MKNLMLASIAGLICMNPDAQNDMGAGGAVAVDATEGGGDFATDFGDAWPTRKRGGGGGRTSAFLNEIRALPEGGTKIVEITMNPTDNGDIKKAGARITSKVYRQTSKDVYAVGFKPITAVVPAGTIVGGKAVKTNQVWIRRPKAATPAPAAVAPATGA